MKKIVIDVDEWISDMENAKYKVNDSAYAKGCNDVLDYYIRKLKVLAEENNMRGTLYGRDL